ncbi:MAG: DUF2330 domain-containing protein [Armatimonadetes bacterium]|nr:DUF2330 domain-containing protein [Armatimonadota bacterium]
MAVRRGAVVFALVAPCLASADGMLLVPVAAESAGFHSAFAAGGVALETDQRAVIIFRDGRETLVLQAAYAAPSSGLAWIIPVPSAPNPRDVFLASQEFIEAAFSDTEPIRSRRMSHGKRGGGVSPALAGVLPFVYLYGRTLGAKAPGGPMGPGMGAGAPGTPEQQKVTIHALLALGPYRVAIISAREGAALTTWLDTHGFPTPEGLPEMAEDYIARGWCFVAATASPQPAAKPLQGSGVSAPGGGVSGPSDAARPSLKYLPPLGITFATPKPVYPLKISRLGSPQRLCLRLVVLAPQPVRLSAAPASSMYEADLPAIIEQVRASQARIHLAGLAASATSEEPKIFLDSARRKFAEMSDYRALVCEARAPLPDIEFRRITYNPPTGREPFSVRRLKDTTIAPGRTLDVRNLYATRFWGLLRGDALDDLTFLPGPAASATGGVAAGKIVSMPFVMRETASGEPAALTIASHWFLAIPPLLVAWLLAAWLVALMQRWLSAPGEAPSRLLSATDAASTALMGVLLFTVLPAFVFAMPAFMPRTIGPLASPMLSLFGLIVLILWPVAILGTLVAPVALGCEAARRCGLTKGYLVGTALVCATWLAAVLASPPTFAGEAHLGIMACATQLGAYSLLGALLAGGIEWRKQLTKAWPLAVYLGLVAGTLVAGTEARLTQGPASRVEGAGEFRQARQAILNAVAAFAHDNGALPRSLKDLTATGPIREGLDSSGNPVRLNLPGGRTPYLPKLPIDPLSGRRDTWTYEPTGDLVVDSKAWTSVSLEPIYLEPRQSSR